MLEIFFVIIIVIFKVIILPIKKGYDDMMEQAFQEGIKNAKKDINNLIIETFGKMRGCQILTTGLSMSTQERDIFMKVFNKKFGKDNKK